MTIVGTAAEFLAAVSALPTDGDVIQLLPGTYSFSSPIEIKPGVTILGSGALNTLLEFSSDGFELGGSGTVTYVTIRGLTITTTGSGHRAIYCDTEVVTALEFILFADLAITSIGVAIDLDPNLGSPVLYSAQVVIDNVSFNNCGAGLITIDGNINTLRNCNNANLGASGFSVTDGLVRVTGVSNLLENMVVGITNYEVSACFYLGPLHSDDDKGGSFVVSNCHAEGGAIDRGIKAVNAAITIDHFDYVPDFNAETLVAAIDAENSSVIVQYLDLESAYSLTTPAPTAATSWFVLDSTSSAAIGTVSASLDVGHLYDPQISIQQVVSTSTDGPGAFALNYPPPTRGDNLIPDITTWTVTTSGTGTISASGIRVRADGKTLEYFVTVTSVGAGFEFAVVVSGVTDAASNQYTMQFRADVPSGAPSATSAAVETYYNDYSQELNTRQHDSLTATKFSSGDSAVSSIEFKVGSPTTGDYAISDVGLWTTY
jgi:hypothetical protein